MWNLRGLFQHHNSKENSVSDGYRKFRRINVILSINCSFSGRQFRIMTDNVSFCGIRFISPMELPVNSIVDIDILLHSDMPALHLKGLVVSCGQAEAKGKNKYIGILEFGALKDEDQRLWENYVKRYEMEDDPFRSVA